MPLQIFIIVLSSTFLSIYKFSLLIAVGYSIEPLNKLPSILNSYPQAGGVWDTLSHPLQDAWGCTYEEITRAQANDFLTS